MLFDIHAHFDDEKFDQDRQEALYRAYNAGVKYIINASSDIRSSEKSIKLAEEYEFVYAAVGVHPHDAETADSNTLKELRALAGNQRVVAIGEIGLDYYYDFSPKQLQKEWFAAQIGLAREVGLPIVVHNRDSHQDVMDILKASEAEDIGGAFHCFSGSVEMARELLNLNFYISIGGVVTFKNARKVKEVVEYIPEDRLLIETDCPYLAPEPYRGRRNESAYIVETAGVIAGIRGTTPEHIAETTAQNAKKLFGIE